jgi:L-threonylcarbamoyladenylate synthase
LPLKATGPSWKMLSAGTKTMGIRRPDNKIALDLATLLGRPITTTSANLSGESTCYSVAQVKKQFDNKKFQPDYYLDFGKLKKTKPSTVVLVGENYVNILREGPITEEEIQSVLNK